MTSQFTEEEVQWMLTEVQKALERADNMPATQSDRSYERGEEIEIRSGRGIGVDSWMPARIKSIDKNGAICEIHNRRGGHHRTTHINWRDMRPLPKKETPNLPSGAYKVVNDLPIERSEEMPEKKTMASVTPIRPNDSNSSERLAEEQGLVRVTRQVGSRTPYAMVGSLLRAARHDRLLTQEQVGLKVNLGKSQVHRLEAGEHKPGDDILIAYAEHMGQDLDQLLLARDRPTEAMLTVSEREAPAVVPAVAVAPPPPPPVPPTPVPLPQQPPKPVPMPTPVATVQPQDMETLFEFCDQVETICPQPTDPALRKQWREYTKGLFQLKSKTLAT